MRAVKGGLQTFADAAGIGRFTVDVSHERETNGRDAATSAVKTARQAAL